MNVDDTTRGTIPAAGPRSTAPALKALPARLSVVTAALLTCLLAFGLATSAHRVVQRAADEPHRRPAVTASDFAVVVADQHVSSRSDLHAVHATAVSAPALVAVSGTEDSSAIASGRTAGSPAARGPPGQALA